MTAIFAWSKNKKPPQKEVVFIGKLNYFLNNAHYKPLLNFLLSFQLVDLLYGVFQSYEPILHF